MQSNYKRLGDYIKDVKVKNVNLGATLLLGINIDKFFMPSVANVIGTDMSNYKIVKKDQFACNRMHVGRDYRIPVALSNKEEPFMISPAYDVFEIIDTTVLLPEYLMMWFSRKEFDRNAWFYTDADVRGGLHWKAFCDMKLPIPSPEKQCEIVHEYNVLQNRITLNNQLISKLEETAQAIYKQWFVDFEFPDENGKAYKSNGGEMEFCEELDKEIPEGWKIIPIKDFCQNMKNGATPSRDNLEYWNSNDIPWLKTGEVSNNILLEAEEYISKLGFKNSSTKILPINSVLMAMYGATAGQVSFLKFEATTNQACCAMICDSIEKASLLYFHLLTNQKEIANMANGGAQANLSKYIIEELPIVSPNENLFINFPLRKLIDNMEVVVKQNKILSDLNDLLLAKMTKVESGLETI